MSKYDIIIIGSGLGGLVDDVERLKGRHIR